MDLSEGGEAEEREEEGAGASVVAGEAFEQESVGSANNDDGAIEGEDGAADVDDEEEGDEFWEEEDVEEFWEEEEGDEEGEDGVVRALERARALFSSRRWSAPRRSWRSEVQRTWLCTWTQVRTGTTAKSR